MRLVLILNLLIFNATSTIATAAVTEYINKPAWQAAAGAYTTITFAELPVNTLVTTQYSPLGATFTDGSDYIDGYFPNTYLNDGFGLNGALDDTWLAFSRPMYSIAVDYPGAVQFLLYSQGELVYISSIFLAPGTGLGGFAGLTSNQSFDQVRITDPTSSLFIDDLHFGPPIPAPGVFTLVALAGLVNRRRRGPDITCAGA